MVNPKYSFLKQWFTFISEDGVTDLVYSCSNNHYIHSLLEGYGHTSFENFLNLVDYNKLIQALNESTNMIPDQFEKHFPDSFIENYSLWNMKTRHHWDSVNNYKIEVKKEMGELFENLWYFNNLMEKNIGILKYNIHYTY